MQAGSKVVTINLVADSFWSKKVAQWQNRLGINRGREIGYKVKLNGRADRWIDRVWEMDMTDVWRQAGLSLAGKHYFTLPRAGRGRSGRFDAKSDYYQARLGAYLARVTQDRKWQTDDYWKMWEAELRDWLFTYGVEDPVAEVNRTVTKETGEIKIGKRSGRLYRVRIAANTDVGHQADQKKLQNLWTQRLEKNSAGKTKPKPTALAGKWHMGVRLDPYQVINLDGLAVVVEVGQSVKALLYVNGCNFTDRLNEKIDTFSKKRAEFLGDLKRMEIVRT